MSGVSEAGQGYRDLLLRVDYGRETTYVIGHKSPDADTVCSAMACANLLRELGIRAEAAVSGELNQETRFALGRLGLEPPPILDHAEGRQFVLVDHSAYLQAIDGMENARIVGIIDHHGIGDAVVSERIYVRSAPVGSTATLLFHMYRECEVPLSRDMARVLLVGLLSDTRNASRSMTVFDWQAFSALRAAAGLEDIGAFYREMQAAASSYAGMTDRAVFLSDYKEYEAAGVRFGIASLTVAGEENMRELADRMAAVMDELRGKLRTDMLFCKIGNRLAGFGPGMYVLARGEGAEELLASRFRGEQRPRWFVSPQNLSRKESITPAIMAALTEQKASASNTKR